MSLIMGIVGLPNVGKSSLFNALTNSEVLVENRPFATIEPNLGIVKLLDPRIDCLAKIVNPEKIVYSVVKFLDIAGLVKGASKGEGLGNKFLENIRSVDAICLVVRAFKDSDVLSVNSHIDPVFEAEIILMELIYSDLEMIENILRKLKSNDPRVDLLNRMKCHLQNNKLISLFPFSEKEKEELKIYSFLTDKPLLIVANVDDSEDLLIGIKEYANSINASFLAMNIRFELELNALSEDERRDFLELYDKSFDNCLNKLVSLAYAKLGLNTFFTVGKKEVRAWTFKIGSNAAECAGIIHSDMKRGFIKARITKYEDFVELKDFKVLKQQGKVSLQGRDYVVQDGDIVHFEFNV